MLVRVLVDVTELTEELDGEMYARGRRALTVNVSALCAVMFGYCTTSCQ